MRAVKEFNSIFQVTIHCSRGHLERLTLAAAFKRVELPVLLKAPHGWPALQDDNRHKLLAEWKRAFNFIMLSRTFTCSNGRAKVISNHNLGRF